MEAAAMLGLMLDVLALVVLALVMLRSAGRRSGQTHPIEAAQAACRVAASRIGRHR